VPPPPGYVITPSGQQPIRSANDTTEFRRNYGANEFVNGLYAQDSGYTGKGVVVAVLDDGVVNVNGELDGRIDTALSKDFGTVTSGGVTTKRNVLGDSHSDHGTAVANIIAANRNGSGSMGFAPDATIAVLRISDWDEDAKTEVLTHVVEALDYAGSKGIKLVNSSLSSGTSQVYADTLTRFGATGGLIINSAGNNGAASPNDAGSINDSNRNAVIFVGALAANINAYAMESYSNRAGTMMDRYVVAVGTNVTTSLNGTLGTFSGTSSATPTVAALAATILSKWPQLSGQQAGDVILNTAKDLGAPGTDPIYGRGLVDFKAALSPVNPSLSNGSKQTSVQTSVMAVPSAMGITSIQSALSNVTVLDEYGRDFNGSVSDMVIKPEVKQGHWLRRRVQQMGPGGGTTLAVGGFASSFGFATNRVGPREGDVRTTVTAGSMQYIADGYGFRAGWNAQDSMQSDVMGLAPFADGILAYAPQAGNSFGVDRYVGGGKLGLTVSTGRYEGSSANAATLAWSKNGTDLRVSFIDESGTIMGTPTGQGALRLGRGATTAMIEAHRTFAIGSFWTIEGYGSMGVTRLKIDQASLVTGSSAIIGSRLGVQASGPAFGGLVSFGIAQPLTIESGSAKLTYGTGYDLASRSLTYGSTDASLAGQRRLQLTAGFSKGGPRSSFRFGVMQDVNQGAFSALTGWSLRF
jgi:hypothetical protein